MCAGVAGPDASLVRLQVSGGGWGVLGAQEAGAGAGSWALLREGPSASPSRLLTVILKCSSLFSLDEVGILMILIILKGQQRSFESPSVLARNQLINWKPFSSVCERGGCLV